MILDFSFIIFKNGQYFDNIKIFLTDDSLIVSYFFLFSLVIYLIISCATIDAILFKNVCVCSFMCIENDHEYYFNIIFTLSFILVFFFSEEREKGFFSLYL